jgi:hypothetical protein
MLVQKRMSTKKLAVYLSILLLTLGAIGLVLYLNRNIAVSEPANENSGAVDLLQESETAITGNGAAANQPMFDPAIIDSEKFKALEESVVIPPKQTVTGKRDPFKPN